MRISKILVAGIMAIILAGVLSAQEDAEALWKNGNKWFRIGRFDEAIVSYTKAIELNPEYAEAYNNRGEAYFQKDDREDAIRDYTRAIELVPDEPKYYNNRGNAYRELGQLEKALADFNKAVEVDKNYNAVYFNRCALYYDTGKLDEALSDCDRAVELMPAADLVWLRRGMLNLEMKNLDRAVLDFSKAISLQGQNIKDAYRWRSDAHKEKGGWEKAVRDMEEALNFSRRDSDTLARLAMLLASVPDDKLRDGELALNFAAQAVAFTSEKDASALEALAAAHAEKGEFDKAVENQKKAIALGAKDDKEKAEMEKRLKLYTEKKPYRLGAEAAGDVKSK